MDQSQSWILIIVAMLIVGSIFAPPVISEFFSGMRDLFEDFRDAWLGDWGDGFNGDGDADGYNALGGIGLEIHYDDGTIKDYKAESTTLLPLTIYDEVGHEIRFVVCYVYATLEYDGTLTQYGYKGRFVGTIKSTHAQVFEDIDTTWIKGTNWNSGDEKQLMAHTIYPSDLESVLSTEGSYRLELFGVNFDLYVDFADGTHEEKTNVGAMTTWDFSYAKTSGIKSLTITVTRTIYK